MVVTTIVEVVGKKRTVLKNIPNRALISFEKMTVLLINFPNTQYFLSIIKYTLKECVT